MRPLENAGRDGVVALLRLAALDAELDRLRESVVALHQPLERERSGLRALAELIEQDERQAAAKDDEGLVTARRRRLLENRRTRAELESALKQDEGEALAMSDVLRQRTTRLTLERQALLVRIEAPLKERYEAGLVAAQRPVLVALSDGRCPGCGSVLSDASRQALKARLSVLPCPGCLRIVYDRGWTERDLMPSTLRAVARRAQ